MKLTNAQLDATELFGYDVEEVVNTVEDSYDTVMGASKELAALRIKKNVVLTKASRARIERVKKALQKACIALNAVEDDLALVFDECMDRIPSNDL